MYLQLNFSFGLSQWTTDVLSIAFCIIVVLVLIWIIDKNTKHMSESPKNPNSQTPNSQNPNSQSL